MDDAEPLEHLQVLRLEPGDVLVFTFPNQLSVAQVRGLQEKIEREFPGHKALVVDSGGQMGVLRSDGDPA